MTRTVLVTGATGFIGTNLCRRLLATGHQVRVLLRPTSLGEALGDLPVQRFTAAPDNPDQLREAVAGAEHVYHLAGLLTGPPSQLAVANAGFSGALAAASLGLDRPPVFIYVSSLAAAGPSPPGGSVAPADPPQPLSDYGHSKWNAERVLLARASELPLSIVRPGIVFGPGDRELVQLFRTIRRLRVNPVAGRTPPPVSMIHVEDLVDLLLRVAERGRRAAGLTPDGAAVAEGGQGVYFAVDPVPMGLDQAGRIVARAIQRPRAVTLRLPIPLVQGAAWVIESTNRFRRRPMTLTRDKIREARASGWCGDPQSAMTDLEWAPARPLPERLAEAALWSLQQGEL